MSKAIGRPLGVTRRGDRDGRGGGRATQLSVSHLNYCAPIKCCILIWEGSDGRWYWSNDWGGATVNGGFRTRQAAVDDCQLYGGQRYWWPQFLDVAR